VDTHETAGVTGRGLDRRRVEGAYVWRKTDVAHRSDWIWHLTDAHLADLERAVAAVHRRGLALEDVTAADFPLPSLAADLAAIATTLENGLGFALVRGLPIARYDEATLGLIFWGLGSHLGVGVSQSYRGDKLGQVIDRGEVGRYYTAGGPIEMHMDPVDVVGLLCIRKARRGGESRIVSSFAVHNAILADQPAAIDPLYRGFHYSSRPVDRVNEPAHTPHRVPVFATDRAGRPACFYLPISIRSATKLGIALSDAELAALDLVDAAANRDALYLDMTFEPGDMQFLNNRRILHGRTDYEDPPNEADRRLLLRLWLMIPGWAPLPTTMRIHGEGDKLGGGIPKRDDTPA